MSLQDVQHRPREHVCAGRRVADRNHGDVGFGKAECQSGRSRHARQHTAEAAVAAALMTLHAIFVISRRMDPQSDSSCPTCSSWWRLPVLLALVLAAIFLSRDRLIRELPRKKAEKSSEQSGSSDAREHVSVTIDFGDGKPKSFDSIVSHEGGTVADVLSDLPNVAIQQKGSGSTAFLVSIDGVANDDAAGRYWMYSVNGKTADRSFAIYKLQPGDHVLWTFGLRQ